MTKEAEMTVRALCDGGYLQEVNRQFLHPLGLVLAIVIPDDAEDHSEDPAKCVVLDTRADLEGVVFDWPECSEGEEGATAKDVALRVLIAERKPVREAALGFWVQPLPNAEG